MGQMGLILTRKPGEQIVIGNDEIVITYVGLDSRGKARIAVKAPTELAVHRREVFERIRSESFKDETEENAS